MTLRANRRQFLQSTTMAGVGYWVSGIAAADESKSPNEKLRIACIGVGGKGSSDTDHAAIVGDVVAICDIDDNRLQAKGEKLPKAKKYHDFRKMLEENEKNIDAVTVSTADHTHAPAGVMAMKMGKHVYCQKPLTHTVHEARIMRETARANKVCTQMGNQGTADSGFRRAVEVIRDKAIGDVQLFYVWTNRPFHYWKQAPDIVARPPETPPVPPHVQWDLFLGPAPVRPYNPAYHPHNWRGFWDFGTGALGDMGCHTANMPFMGLKLGLPVRVSAEHSEVNQETYPAWSTITYEFPARGDLPAVKMIWYEGAKDGKRHLPPEDIFQGEKPSDSGSILIGSKGSLFSPNDYGADYSLLPKKDFEGYKPPEKSLPRNIGIGGIDVNQKREWAAAIKAGKPEIALSNFDYASVLTESILLGNIAVRSGESFEYDGETGTILSCPAASKYLHYEYRDGWTL